MKTYTIEEVTDEFIGKKGTPERDAFDAEVLEAVKAYELGEAIRAERERKNLTQRQLSVKAGIDERTLSKAENGHGTTMTSLSRIFRALGVTSGSLDLGSLGRVALW